MKYKCHPHRELPVLSSPPRPYYSPDRPTPRSGCASQTTRVSVTERPLGATGAIGRAHELDPGIEIQSHHGHVDFVGYFVLILGEHRYGLSAQIGPPVLDSRCPPLIPLHEKLQVPFARLSTGCLRLNTRCCGCSWTDSLSSLSSSTSVKSGVNKSGVTPIGSSFRKVSVLVLIEWRSLARELLAFVVSGGADKWEKGSRNRWKEKLYSKQARCYNFRANNIFIHKLTMCLGVEDPVLPVIVEEFLHFQQ
ncbi:unnamed protein product [Oppiella nova]|uniref:Uncharacterized protein n=1 Tax=Oppiella nova TaxID=334625 RepID=A0A7R9M3B2_9ACAR|nr:unnamed protein product [Oppiella nova]CAG2169966.1 unnamed protein product [Oppiella nova]